jgi:outer membrane autotransporter protein
MVTPSSKNNFRLTVIAHSVGLALAALTATPAFAVPTCPAPDGSGLITVTTTITTGCTLSNTTPVTSLSVSGTGSVSGSGYGVTVSGGTYGSIQNDGLISSSFGRGVSLNGAYLSGDIRNGGTIIGAGTALNIANSNIAGAVNNAGALSGELAINASTISGGIQNAGYIDGNISISNGSLITGDIANTVTGSVSGGINVYGSSSISGAVTNAGSASYIQIYNGSLVHGITNSGTTGGIYVSSGTVAGAITNTGTVSGSIYVGSGGAIANGITNSGAVGYIAVTNSTVTGGIANTGTIGDSSQALYLYNSSLSGGITNHSGATISGRDYGVLIDSGSTVTGGIRNDGVISASGTLSGGSYYGGQAVWISGHVDNVVNTGSITANETGIRVNGNAVISGSISNSGTISGRSIAIYVDPSASIAGGIVNTGLLDGQVYLGNSALNLNGTTGRVVGSISGSSGSVVNVNGTFTMENTIQAGAVNIASTGVLKTGAGNVIDSSVVNSGTLAVTTNSGNVITGDYTQTSTGALQSDVAGISQYGALQVNGTADLTQGGIKVNTSTPTLALTNGATNTILTAGTLHLNPNIAVTDNSLLFDFQAAQVGNTIQLKTVAAAVNNSANTVSSSVNTQGNSAARGAATVLDQMIAQGSSAPAAFQPVVNALGTLKSQKEVSDAISQTLPLMTAGMSQSMLNTLQGTNQVIQSRQGANLGRSSGDEFLGDRQFWFKPLGSWAKQNDRNGVSGYDANTYGMVFGIDGTLSDKNSIGGAFAYTSTKVDSNSSVANQHASIDGYQLALYGAYKLDDSVSITYQGDIGNNQANGDRRINFGGINTTANSDFSSWSTHLGLGIGKIMNLDAKTTFTPSLRADYTRLRTNSYTETGAGALNLNVAGNTTEELVLGIDGGFSRALTDSTSLVANLGVGYDTLSKRASTTASYVGGGAAFATQGINPSPWLMRGGLGLVMHNGPLVSVSARYDVESRESFTNQTASVKVNIKF